MYKNIQHVCFFSQEVLVQEVKPTGDETVGGHDRKVKTKKDVKKVNNRVHVVFCACICFWFFLSRDEREQKVAQWPFMNMKLSWKFTVYVDPSTDDIDVDAAQKVVQQKSRNQINWNLSLLNWCNYVLCQAINSRPSFVSFVRNLAARENFERIKPMLICHFEPNLLDRATSYLVFFNVPYGKVVVWLGLTFSLKRKWCGVTKLLHLLWYLPAAANKLHLQQKQVWNKFETERRYCSWRLR